MEEIGKLIISNKDWESRLLNLLSSNGYSYEIIHSNVNTFVTLFSPEISAAKLNLEESMIKTEISNAIKDFVDAQLEKEKEVIKDEIKNSTKNK